MITINIPAVSYAIGAAAFLVLTLLLLTAWRGRLQGGLLVSASAVTALWLAAVAVYAVYRIPPFSALQLLEVLRGTDMVKAVALGADAVGIGRLFGYGIAAAG